jgi:hypothetical protein
MNVRAFADCPLSSRGLPSNEVPLSKPSSGLRRLLWARTLPLLAVLSLRLSAADPALLRLLHPDVNIAIGFQPWSISQAPIVKFSVAESERLGLPTDSRPEWAELKAALGEEPLRYFEEIILAARVRSFDERTQPEHVLLLLRGPYDGRIVELACGKGGGCESSEYRGVTIRQTRKELEKDAPEEAACFVVLDARYAAFGKRVDLENLLDRRAGVGDRPLNATMAQWVAELGDSHFWVAAQGPFDWPAGQSPDASETPPQFWQLAAAALKETFAKIDGVGLGLHLASGLTFSLKLGARTGENAEAFAETLRGLWRKVEEEAAARPELQVRDRLHVSQEGNFVTASVIVPQEDLEQQVRSQLAKRAHQLKSMEAAGGEPAAVREAPAPRRRSSGIRIDGLESGPVEFPVTPR